jgi:DNA replication protein DnaC
VVYDGGQWAYRAGQCQKTVREQRRMIAAHIPERFRYHILDGYHIAFRGTNAPLGEEHIAALMCIRAYSFDPVGKGLSVGSIGVG